MRPDITGIDRCFDYAVPKAWADNGSASQLRVGSRVRVDLHGRRVAAWVVELDPQTPDGVTLRELRKWSGYGPTAEVLSLATWTAHRWAGSPVHLLRTASPERNVMTLDDGATDPSPGSAFAAQSTGPPWARAAFDGAVSVVRIGPAGDRWPVIAEAVRRGNPLLLVPTVEIATALARRLRNLGVTVAEMPTAWKLAASGATVVGARASVFAPLVNPGSIVVLDEHDEAYREERAPTWHARDVAVERARRLGVPCVLVSPCLSAEATIQVGQRPATVTRVDTASGDVESAAEARGSSHSPDRRQEYAQWPAVTIIDRRDEPPGRVGLFADALTRHLSPDHRTGFILNRKGRVRLLACAACGELTRCDRCQAIMNQPDGSSLRCGRCAHERPAACADCGGLRLKNLVLGVSRAREELAALLGEPVGEFSATTQDEIDARVVIGTEALLRTAPHPSRRWHQIVFLDFDQHLGALRQRAEPEAMSLLILAARLVGARSSGARILVQTRQPEHRVLRAALRGDTAELSQSWVQHAETLRWPPAFARAQVSGAAAAEFVESFGQPVGVEILGPVDGQWQLRAPSIDVLTDALAHTTRPSGRVRVEVT